MAVFKCKMCGGALEVNDNSSTATCDFCGSQQTLPRLNDDKIERLYDRANHFRRNNEFDKAMEVYEQILDENNEDAESYWSIILCRYGIEYVEDPVSHKRIPTVNRAQFTSIFDDDNYKSAIKYADILQKSLYEQEAIAINEIQKGILDISQKEEPFDVFICYKETDASGQRTRDSVYANELYHELTEEGFKVFFARITLEDKLGIAYEPYIFAALNSAKVMVVLGTKPEYFNAVWVKNEWSRYLALIKKGEKKILIPAYRDMDPYDLPIEFSHLQAQDMNKLGFMPDLVRGIKKLVGVQPKPAQAYYTSAQPANTNVGDNQLYNVRLQSFGTDKLHCIKIVRETLGVGLKDAKDLVESRTPLLARSVSLYEAERIKNVFLINGLDAVIEEAGRGAQPRSYSVAGGGDTETLLKRVMLFLEGGDWGNADIYCEKVLDIDPENPQAYVGKLLAQLHCHNEEELVFSKTPLEGMMPYKNALRFADEATAARLIEYNRKVNANIARRESERQERERREEAARQEQARVQHERKLKEEKRRQELSALQSARNNTANLISSQIKEKERLEALIAKKQIEAQKASDPKKIRRLARTVLFWVVFNIVMFFVIGISASEGNDSGSVGLVLMFFAGLLLALIYSAKLLKADGKSVALVLLNFFTYGIFGVVFAIIKLRKNKKNAVPSHVQELNALNAQLQQIESQLDGTRRSLSEINHKIETYQ